MKTWKQINDEAAAKVAAFFAGNAGAFTAAQAGYLAGAAFVSYTSDALLRAIDALETAGAIERVGYRAGSPTYRAAR